MKALSELSKKLKYHELTNIKVIHKASKSSSKNRQFLPKNNRSCYYV